MRSESRFRIMVRPPTHLFQFSLRTLVLLACLSGMAGLWVTRGPAWVLRFKKPEGRSEVLAVSEDRSLVLVVSFGLSQPSKIHPDIETYSYSCKLLNATEPQAAVVLKEISKRPIGGGISKDHALVSAVVGETECWVWDAQTGNLKWVLGQDQRIRDAWFRSNRAITAIFESGEIGTWTLPGAAYEVDFKAPPEQPNQEQFCSHSRNGNHVIWMSGAVVRLYNLERHNMVSMDGEEFSLGYSWSSSPFSLDSSMLVTTNEDGFAFWDTGSGTRVRSVQFKRANGRFSHAIFGSCPNKAVLVEQCVEPEYLGSRVMDVRSWNEQCFEGQVFDVSPDASRILVAKDEDCAIQSWSEKSPRQVFDSTGGEFLGTSDLVLGRSVDGWYCLWSKAHAERLHERIEVWLTFALGIGCLASLLADRRWLKQRRSQA
ncbi:MAG: hypothetical protein KIS92_22160 [Planctomycetota bacterium]|nr:hypothetical protein [Planctomycetota bacterium]